MASSRDWHRKRKARLVAYKGGKCVDCGGIFPDCCYDFDHRDPLQKSFSISSVSARAGMPLSDIEKETDKCDLVCANCHRIRTYGNESISQKMRLGMKGIIPWNKGIEQPYSPESILKMSEGQKKRFSENPAPAKGCVRSSEQRKKISDTLKRKGIHPSLAACRRGGSAVTGEPKRRWGNKFACKKEAA